MESPPRGTKRDAEGVEITASGPRRIRALDIDVVNKIAAGEIIVAPVNALKELIENAIDAGSTQLEILVKEGGLKLLQITDNGHGINKEDLDILCERFTTSKLQTFEDLNEIATYGFRGEALASISHIAHLTVTSRTEESNCAWRAYYQDGKLAPPKPGQPSEPKATAGRQGTQITVEDLFYNTPNRRRAFRSSSEEYAKILDMVGRYAVHSHGVAFLCKKHGDSSASISVPAAASVLDRIRQIHGTAVATELVNFELADEKYGFRGDCWATNANYHVKRTSLLLFINHRAVESSAIKKALDQVYATFLPKGGHPFVYLSLEIEPQRVDVNVHPTKREVNFLYEDEIISIICGDLREALSKVDKSRMFLVQTVLPGTNIENRDPSSSARPGTSTPASNSKAKKPLENNLVRTDSKARKITSMFAPSQRSTAEGASADLSIDPIYDSNDKPAFVCRLTSIKELRSEVRENIHRGLTEAFSGHTWVGVVDETRRLVAIQGGVKLFLVNYGLVCQEFFYQIGLTDFGNFGEIRFEPPLDLRELVLIAARYDVSRQKDGDITMGGTQESQEDAESIADETVAAILSHAAMLAEYFSFHITEDGKLTTIPLLIKGYTPPLAKLPRFLVRLANEIDWTEEKACFAGFLQELAKFYVPESLPRPPTVAEGEEPPPEDAKLAARKAHIHSALEKVLFPAFRTSLVPTKALLDGVTEIANLKQLYRIFERC